MNSCRFTGNLVEDPELRYTTGGVEVCEFCIAVERRFKDNSGKLVKKVVYPRLTAWSSGAKTIAENFVKGDSITISDSVLMQDSYVDKEGKTRQKFYFRVGEFEFPRVSVKQAERRIRLAAEYANNNNNGDSDGSNSADVVDVEPETAEMAAF